MDFDEYSQSFIHFHTTEVPYLLRTLINENQDIIDVGAGDGAILVSLRASGLLDNAKSVTAVDISPIRCERLRRYTDFKVHCADALMLKEIDPASYDLIICTQVIEHVNEKELIDEIKRIMRPNGIIYVASLVKKSYGWWYYKTLEGKWGLDPTHLREYKSVEHFENVLKENGLKIIETTTSKLKLSVVEFFVRRLFSKFIAFSEINRLFSRSKIADFLRRNISISPLGYYIVESVAVLDDEHKS